MKVPCKDCVDRSGECHSVCEKYKSFLEYNDKIKRARLADSHIIDFLSAQGYRRHKNPTRKKGN